MFKTNVGTTDRVARVILGLLLIVAFFMMGASGWGWAALIVGVILAGTGVMSSCPLYSVLGMNTCPANRG